MQIKDITKHLHTTALDARTHTRTHEPFHYYFAHCRSVFIQIVFLIRRHRFHFSLSSVRNAGHSHLIQAPVTDCRVVCHKSSDIETPCARYMSILQNSGSASCFSRFLDQANSAFVREAPVPSRSSFGLPQRRISEL